MADGSSGDATPAAASPSQYDSGAEAARLRSVRDGTLVAGPETLQINLRNACNLGCRFCWNHSPLTPDPPPDWHRARLSDAHLAKIIDDLPRLRPGHALLSGRGEPLLHPGVGRLLSALREASIPVTIQTNGTSGPEPAELVALGVSRLLVNLSAATPAGYARVHPGRGHLYDHVVGRLHGLAAARRGEAGPQVTLVSVVHGDTASEIGPLLELAAEVGAEAVMLKGMELPPLREARDALTPLLLGPVARGRAREAVAHAQGRAVELGITLHAAHLEQLVDHQSDAGCFTRPVGEVPCAMGWYYLRVTVDGRVMFCCKDKLVDHLDRRSLYAIWRSAAYHHLRLSGRDGDGGGSFFDDRCRSCSNFARNREVLAALDTLSPRV